jgi:hypothetical protein
MWPRQVFAVDKERAVNAISGLEKLISTVNTGGHAGSNSDRLMTFA